MHLALGILLTESLPVRPSEGSLPEWVLFGTVLVGSTGSFLAQVFIRGELLAPQRRREDPKAGNQKMRWPETTLFLVASIPCLGLAVLFAKLGIRGVFMIFLVGGALFAVAEHMSGLRRPVYPSFLRRPDFALLIAAMWWLCSVIGTAMSSLVLGPPLRTASDVVILRWAPVAISVLAFFWTLLPSHRFKFGWKFRASLAVDIVFLAQFQWAIPPPLKGGDWLDYLGPLLGGFMNVLMVLIPFDRMPKWKGYSRSS